MVRLVWRGILANLGRLALTLVSVVLSVAPVVLDMPSVAVTAVVNSVPPFPVFPQPAPQPTSAMPNRAVGSRGAL